MDSIKFYALLKAVEYGSLTRAAENLGYTQAGLTHMMNRLEKELGVTLLSRTKSGVRLTPDGESLLPYVKSFVDESSRLENAIKNIKIGGGRILRVAAYASITKHWIPEIIRRFSETYPNLRLEIHVASLEEISELVYNGDMDVGFVSLQENIRCDWFHLCNDPLYAILPPDEEVEGDTVPIEFFEGRTFYMPTYGFDHDILNMLNMHGVNPAIDPTAVDDATVASLVSHGLGYSILPKLIIGGMHDSCIAKPISPHSYRDLGIIVKSKDSMTSAAQKFVACSRAVVRDLYNGDTV
ncbi:MAG: LysR family transcriptional regulator [Clostridia bacterium]|nr:LysR family transcriptional regulator [Clostridia bacterium]